MLYPENVGPMVSGGGMEQRWGFSPGKLKF